MHGQYERRDDDHRQAAAHGHRHQLALRCLEREPGPRAGSGVERHAVRAVLPAGPVRARREALLTVLALAVAVLAVPVLAVPVLAVPVLAVPVLRSRVLPARRVRGTRRVLAVRGVAAARRQGGHAAGWCGGDTAGHRGGNAAGRGGSPCLRRCGLLEPFRGRVLAALRVGGAPGIGGTWRVLAAPRVVPWSGRRRLLPAGRHLLRVLEQALRTQHPVQRVRQRLLYRGRKRGARLPRSRKRSGRLARERGRGGRSGPGRRRVRQRAARGGRRRGHRRGGPGRRVAVERRGCLHGDR